jgi:ABC-type transporter MlaC component
LAKQKKERQSRAGGSVYTILWTKLFLENQGYKVKQNNLHEDNRTAIMMEKMVREAQARVHILFLYHQPSGTGEYYK